MTRFRLTIFFLECADHCGWVMCHGYCAKGLSRTAPRLFPFPHSICQRTSSRHCLVTCHLNSTHHMSTMNMPNAPPELLTISDKKYRPIREGLASILAPYRD